MGLEITHKKNHDVDEFTSIHLPIPKQQHIENWLDGSEFEPSCKEFFNIFSFDIFVMRILANHGNHMEFNEPITAMTINRLEEQIQMLKVKVEDINARLENVTSILHETHPGILSSSDVSNFNARLVIVENELAMLRRKTPQVYIYIN